jgi:hypothetical protein
MVWRGLNWSKTLKLDPEVVNYRKIFDPVQRIRNYTIGILSQVYGSDRVSCSAKLFLHLSARSEMHNAHLTNAEVVILTRIEPVLTLEKLYSWPPPPASSAFHILYPFTLMAPVQHLQAFFSCASMRHGVRLEWRSHGDSKCFLQSFHPHYTVTDIKAVLSSTLQLQYPIRNVCNSKSCFYLLCEKWQGNWKW